MKLAVLKILAISLSSSFICIPALAHSDVQESEQIPKADIKQFAAEYRSIESEYERLAFCIKLIKLNVICRYMHVSTIDNIFGTNIGRDIPRIGETTGGLVLFGKLPPAPKGCARQLTCWRLIVEYGSDGNLQNYSLSNCPAP